MENSAGNLQGCDRFSQETSRGSSVAGLRTDTTSGKEVLEALRKDRRCLKLANGLRAVATAEVSRSPGVD